MQLLDIPGNPIPMGHRDGMDSWDLGGMVGDIPGNPVPSRWVIGMGWTVGICVGWLGTSQVIPSHPDGSSGWDGQLGSGWDGWGHPR